jgi:hypothetical protein
VPTDPDRRPRRGWLGRIGLVLLGCFAAFALCEIGFRVVERIQLARAGELWAVYDARIGWRLNPKFGDHNPDGLRDHPVQPKAGRTRLLILGDSVPYYGDSVDDTLVGHLRGELARTRDPASFDVLDAGVKGYTNWQELQFLKERGLAFEPDLVGVAFVLNDCYRTLHQFRVEDGKLVGQDYDFSDEALQGEPWTYRALRTSHFLLWLRHRISSVQPVPAGDYTFDHRPDFKNAWKDEPWLAIEAQMREMVDLGRAKGFRVFLVAFPFGDQYRPDYLARDRDYVLKPQRKLAEICARLSIPCLDLFPLLDPSADLLDDRIHLTAAGRAKAAAGIAEFLDSHRLLPAR